MRLLSKSILMKLSVYSTWLLWACVSAATILYAAFMFVGMLFITAILEGSRFYKSLANKI